MHAWAFDAIGFLVVLGGVGSSITEVRAGNATIAVGSSGRFRIFARTAHVTV